MNKLEFFRKVTPELIGMGYHFDANEFSKDDVQGGGKEHIIRKAIDLIGELASLPAVASGLNPVFKSDAFRKDIDKVYEYAELVFYKFVLSQPVIVALVDADDKSSPELINLAREFDQSILSFLKHTGRLGIVKMGATGILFFVFSDADRTERFIQNDQKKCKISHVWKKTYVVPWAIDLSTGIIHRHSGIPYVPGVLNRAKLEKRVFASSLPE